MRRTGKRWLYLVPDTIHADETLYLVHSTEFNGKLLTGAAYSELRFTMEPGDFRTHIATPIDVRTAALSYNLNEIIDIEKIS